MFQLKAQGKYGMYKKHTQNASLIYSACFMSRIIPVICYNFLLLFKVENSEYSNVIDSLDIIPYLGEEYSRYLPILIGVVCISNVFNVYNRFMKAVGLENFTFEEVLNKKNKIQGKALLAKARTEKEREVRQKKNLSHVKSISVIDDFEESFSISASLQ